MRVLFDFDFHRKIEIDSHLVDIMLALKRDIIYKMQPFKEEISTNEGWFIVTLLPEEFNIIYTCISNIPSSQQIEIILKNYDWETVINNFGKSELS